MKPYYQDEWSTIYHGDSRELLQSLPICDLILTDPPYGIGGHSERNESRAKGAGRLSSSIAYFTDYGEVKWDNRTPSKAEISLIIAAGKEAIIWGGNYFHVPPARGWLVWDKQNSGDFADGEIAWTNLKTAVRIFRFTWNGMIRAGEDSRKQRVHPTQKPVELMRWCLGFAPNAESVCDPYMGSGPVLRAAKDLNRKSIGIEIEERYCETAAKRLEQGALNFTPDVG